MLRPYGSEVDQSCGRSETEADSTCEAVRPPPSHPRRPRPRSEKMSSLMDRQMPRAVATALFGQGLLPEVQRSSVPFPTSDGTRVPRRTRTSVHSQSLELPILSHGHAVANVASDAGPHQQRKNSMADRRRCRRRHCHQNAVVTEVTEIGMSATPEGC